MEQIIKLSTAIVGRTKIFQKKQKFRKKSYVINPIDSKGGPDLFPAQLFCPEICSFSYILVLQ